MVNYKELITTILDETLACQDPASQQSLTRHVGRYGPFGAHVPGDKGSYPTTEKAMSALAELADGVRENNHDFKLSVGRDAMRKITSEVFGAHLQELAREADPAKRWKSILRDPLMERARSSGKDLVHYIPVWLFVAQNCEPFQIGPVKFVQRATWLKEVELLRGSAPKWIETTKAIWSGSKFRGGSSVAALKSVWHTIRKGNLSPETLHNSFVSAKRMSEPRDVFNGRAMARVLHPDQWMACAKVNGFEPEESRRRGLLAAQVALDTVRIALVRPSRGLISTAADLAAPRSVERLNQIPGHDLAHGWHLNMPGVSGAPGLAEAIIAETVDLFEAAGSCIATVSSTTGEHECPVLAERWFNAAHWFGRACMVDADFVAIVMLVIALDVLSGGLQNDGITELIARLTGIAKSHVLLGDGTTLKKLVDEFYGLRSEVAHGSVLAVHRQLDQERAGLEDLTASALDYYVVKLRDYALSGGVDDRDSFLASLPPAKS
ncbi:hypothetical protein ACUTJJ_06140 [Agrobacterium sp. DKPNP3]|uniref:hypothetical protein n=1 Tax=Agrobacterium sp. DKPNP3 TaxID=3457323 RepID=UPI004044792E